MNRPDDEFRTFVESRAAALHRSAYLLCGDWHLAHDLVQEALAKAYGHWGRIVRADNPDTYVRRIVVNEANRYWRRTRHRGRVVDSRHDRPAPDRVAPDLSEIARQGVRPCNPAGTDREVPNDLDADPASVRATRTDPAKSSLWR